MRNKLDLIVVKYLYMNALIFALLVFIWLVFNAVKNYQDIHNDIDNYLEKLISGHHIEFAYDKKLEQLYNTSIVLF